MTTSSSSTNTTADRVPELVSAKVLTARFGLTKKGVSALPIPKIKIGRRAIRYRLRDVIDFIERRTITANPPRC